MLVTSPYAATQKICHPSMSLFAFKSGNNIQKLIVRRFPHHLTWLQMFAYRIKPHHTRNQYLRARLDTCANVNIMSASVYKFVFNDPDLKKLAPSTLEIGTYTTDTVKIVGSCLFYLAHLDTMNLQEVTFYVAQNDGSVLLFCTTTLALGLIQPCTRLDYLPPRASLFTSAVDHPKKKPRECLFTVQEKKYLFKAQNKQLQCLINNN